MRKFVQLNLHVAKYPKTSIIAAPTDEEGNVCNHGFLIQNGVTENLLNDRFAYGL